MERSMPAALGSVALVILFSLAQASCGVQTDFRSHRQEGRSSASNPAFGFTSPYNVDTVNSAYVTGPSQGFPGHVKAFDYASGNNIASFYAYPATLLSGINVAIGPVMNGGDLNIITAPQAGAAPHVKVFKMDGSLSCEFFAYAASFIGGVRLTVAKVGPGKYYLITAPGSNGGPHIRVYDLSLGCGVLVDELYVYAASYTGGVYPSAGDLNGDGIDELVVGASGSTHTKAYKFVGQHLTLLDEFFASYLASGPATSSAPSSGLSVVSNGKIVTQYFSHVTDTNSGSWVNGQYVYAGNFYYQKFHAYSLTDHTGVDVGTAVLPIGSLFSLPNYVAGGQVLNAAAIKTSSQSQASAIMATVDGSIVWPSSFVGGMYTYGVSVTQPYGSGFHGTLSIAAWSK